MIRRYDLGEAIRKSGDYWSTMTESKDGDYVTHDDHRAVVGELVEALRKSVLALAHADEQSPGLYGDAYETVSAAIEKVTWGEG